MKRLSLVICLLYLVLSALGTTMANGQQDYFTEEFSSGYDAFDLANKSIMFTPTVDGTSYRACLQEITQLPTNPAGGTNLELSDDDYMFVRLNDQKTVSIFGSRFDGFYVGSNGYITFTEGDTFRLKALFTHFATIRISALFNDLYPSVDGAILWKQLADRVVVTWQNIREYSAGGSNTFQVEMYFDGRILLAWLGITAQQGIVGLSDGLSLPANFQETDLSAYSLCQGGPSKSPIISGYVRTPNGSGISDVLLAFSNDGGNATTDSTGYYSNAVSHGWSGVVTPNKSGYVFNPPSISYSNVTSDISGQNYTGSTGPPTGPLTGTPAEWFSSDADCFDLSYKAIMFTPTAGGTSYDACLYGITHLPTESVGDSDWEPLDDDFMLVNLSDQKTVSIFGSSFSSFYIGTNGYITFTRTDTRREESLSVHFSTKRISALFRDLDPSVGGAVSSIQLADRVVVTWRDVPEYERGGSNTFQVEMYFDGRILLAWLSVTAQQGIVGLSDGLGLPADFHETDFSGCPLCGGQIIGSSATPIAHWAMDDNAANTAVLDSSGKGNQGIAQQNTSALSTSGKIGGALTFNGVSDYIDCGSGAVLQEKRTLTVSAWINGSSYAKVMNMIVCGDKKNLDFCWGLRIDNSVAKFFIRAGNYYAATGSAVSANQWYHVVGVWNRNGGVKNLRIYVNGSLAGTATVNADMDANTVYVIIGRLYYPTVNQYFNGLIDDVRIYNRVLSDTEITALYNEGAGP